MVVGWLVVGCWCCTIQNPHTMPDTLVGGALSELHYQPQSGCRPEDMEGCGVSDGVVCEAIVR